jgi:hypothetical protein
VEKSFAEVALEPYEISLLDEESRTLSSQTRLPLVLVSIDGRKVSSFNGYNELLKYIKGKKNDNEFFSWRFLNPAQCNCGAGPH